MLHRVILMLALCMMSVNIPLSGLTEEGPEHPFENWLASTYPEPGVHWNVVILEGKDELQKINSSEWNIEGNLSKKLKKIMVLAVTLNGETSKKLQVKIRAIPYLRVMVANDLIRPGKELSNLWHWEDKDKDLMPADAIWNENDIQGMRTRKILVRNEVLTLHCLEAIPTIPIGANISIRVLGEGVTITADAISMEDGYTGKLIRCKLCGSGQIVKAEILNSQMAQIVLTMR